MAVPTKDSELVIYSTNFNTRGVASPEDFGLSVDQMSLYTPLHTSWLAAYNACNSEGGKSTALVAGKNSAKANLLPYARELYFQIQFSITVSDENKSLMGITIRKMPAPVPPPVLAPSVKNTSVTGKIARYQITDAQFPNTRPRRPANAIGATIMSFVGTTPPPAGDPSWKLEGQVGKPAFAVNFGNSVSANTPCWVTAMWYSARGAYSPACNPVQVFLQGSISSPEEEAAAAAEQPQATEAA